MSHATSPSPVLNVTPNTFTKGNYFSIWPMVHSRDRASRRYPCDICGRNFLRKCDLTKHVKKCVDLEDESPLLERDSSPLATEESVEIKDDKNSKHNSPNDKEESFKSDTSSDVNQCGRQSPTEKKRPKTRRN